MRLIVGQTGRGLLPVRRRRGMKLRGLGPKRELAAAKQNQKGTERPHSSECNPTVLSCRLTARHRENPQPVSVLFTCRGSIALLTQRCVSANGLRLLASLRRSRIHTVRYRQTGALWTSVQACVSGTLGRKPAR